ncbi:DUF2933 domain-containing protein (plasmid) [Cupriavidus basilensis]|uniref:DUF2933 domain-containing protein n=1 Tax=unclassified Cupriavidus TaxID=2640874 RepID=UPI001365A394|nr:MULTISPECIES: DUF2933 domain-containing protein [unclassified Cupriavidus]
MCSLKTMVKLGVGLAGLLVVAYVLLPQYHAAMRAIAPFALVLVCVLVCPLAMYFGMRGMQAPGKDESTHREDK